MSLLPITAHFLAWVAGDVVDTIRRDARIAVADRVERAANRIHVAANRLLDETEHTEQWDWFVEPVSAHALNLTIALDRLALEVRRETPPAPGSAAYPPPISDPGDGVEV
jgi:hypothetical protein